MAIGAVLRRMWAAIPLGQGLRSTFAAGYSRRDLRADLIAGVTVGVVAVPLAMALAIASGAPPQFGLYTAVVAGFLIALSGGSRFSVSGPTAAFVVILHPIAVGYGFGGLVLASLMAGVILILMGVARMGRFIQFVPHPVTTGFTTGIALVIATLQFKDFLGLELLEQPESFFERMMVLGGAVSGVDWADFGIGVLTLAVLLAWPKLRTGFPPHLIALAVGALVAWLVNRHWPDAPVATVANKFSYVIDGVVHGGIPPLPPVLVLPWSLPGPDGEPLVISLDLIRNLLGPAFAIAVLGAIESLLCAVVADGMGGSRHDPDAELVGQGIGNLVAPFFGGFAATGALARTATNIRSGARSPIAAIVHAGFILAVLVILAPVLGYMPMASLAALLLLTAWNMSELRHFRHVLKVAPRSDIAVLLVCFGLTVVFDMVVAVGVGVVLAAFLFMGRMASFTESEIVEGHHPVLDEELPPGVVVYAVAGPLFFGAAEKAMSALHRIGDRARAVIIDLTDVPVMDVTGLVALESTLARLARDGCFVALAGVQGPVARVVLKAGLRDQPDRLVLAISREHALKRVRQHMGLEPTPRLLTEPIT